MIRETLLALGPGPHLKMPASVLAGREVEKDDPLYNEHLKPSSAPNFEAHNTLLDLFTQSGLIAALSFVWLEATAFAYKARLAALMTALCGLAIFTTFHLVVRHPIVWPVIAPCLVAGDGGVRVIAVRDRG
jgi:hypothetical protein